MDDDMTRSKQKPYLLNMVNYHLKYQNWMVLIIIFYENFGNFKCWMQSLKNSHSKTADGYLLLQYLHEILKLFRFTNWITGIHINNKYNQSRTQII